MTSPLHAAERGAAWKQVDEALAKGLPQTAIEVIEPIIQGALADQAWAEATKAISRKIAIEGQIQGAKAEEMITRLEAQLPAAPTAIRPLLQTVLAEWYWQYFQQNRWRFMQRTATAEAPGKDFTTWDLARLFAEIDGHFTAALAAEALLQSTPIAQWDDLLPKGALPDTYRPTLYDFVAHQALEFYQSGEQAGARPQDAFEIPAASPIFDAPAGFLAWKPDTTDTNAPAFKAIGLYQALLRFHASDADQSAFLDADLARLIWGRNVAAAADRDARFVAALKRFTEENGDHPLAVMGLYRWAEQWRAEGKLAEAHATATRGRTAHPNSPGGMLCGNVIAQIEAKSAHVTTERIWSAPWPTLKVSYANVTNVWIRAVAADWDDYLKREHRRPENLSPAERQSLLARAPALSWSHALPPTTDFRSRTVEFPVPTSLKPGFYFLFASHREDFAEGDNQLSLTDVWVSDLALVLRNRSGNLEGFVLEAESGEPIQDARIQAWHLDSNRNRVEIPSPSTDSNGFFQLAAPQDRGVLIKATARGQSIATADELHRWRVAEPEGPSTQTVFFTDRAIYRPGQLIQYKGICLRRDPVGDRYTALAGEKLTVVFHDPNSQEIARQVHQANDYSSFSGSFIAPRDRLLGGMRLEVVGRAGGSTHFQVEEYKRPKF
ncbi:MAG: MG2 domain-containing protein, partial [Limisphaerales bacterium]